ncbi:ATP-dependent DNA helicase RecG [uncultured Dialister sp.]|jgi:ATP-dependent DNA helicase RecG|uniref:ATP-dependent DNA helicase RecG n=1 Tax=uncultured Dialister sp. TaxID=278064 RepID=UPI0025E1E978|nr:ATP-dependent DNA helicase RecG [uncultured Dialister sp.]
MKLSDSVQYVKGVGPKMKEKLGRLGIHTVEDLISFYPRRYQDWTKITKMEDLRPDEEAVIYGEVADIRKIMPRRGMTILNVLLTDGTSAVTLVYFNQPWKEEQFRRGMHVLAYGKIEYNYGKLQLSNPEIEFVSPEELLTFQKLVPIYPLTEGIRIQQMRNMISFALDHVEDLVENLPEETLASQHLMGRLDAAKAIHNPVSWEQQKEARRRTAFEELFFMQAGILLLRKKRRSHVMGIKCAPSGQLVRSVLHQFPFTLTEGQKQAFTDIENDMEGLVPMQRLIQGDVGSGKTAVAALALAKVVENGYQGALMAPTEVLAGQHYRTFQEFYKGLPIHVAYLSGQTKTKERNEILKGLKEGDIDVLIGTHALIEEDVVFAHLGLVITDEQHRFGVKQRKALETKGGYPHILVMTATPIPRTMALSIYGDLDVSSIRGMPPGRHPVKTYAIGSPLLQRVFNFMGREMTAGHQVYVVCPLVEQSEKQDLASAVSVYEELKTRIFPMFHVGLVHGRMKNDDKEQVMRDFHDGKLNLLVATSVIEVGVNVPNATIMFVYGADRFGLSQLHQLRGRVGRGSAQSYCILYSDNRNEVTQLRMKLMCEIQDGFLLSEKDLLLRGSGEFFGYHQHGMPDLKAADIVKDLPLLEDARREAGKAVDRGMDFKEELSHRFGGAFFKKLYKE